MNLPLTLRSRIGTPHQLPANHPPMPSQQLNTAIRWMMEEPDPVQETLQYLTDSNEEEPPKNTRGPSKDQKRFEGELKLHQDYLSAEPTYNNSDDQNVLGSFEPGTAQYLVLRRRKVSTPHLLGILAGLMVFVLLNVLVNIRGCSYAFPRWSRGV
ncbi:hypothetical protein PSTT_03404 [Puccinia striiformis]|uniref:Uncharacterized protein n=1 Tax=Puccinia striiformis TaxID=27350 RepID=A0A2S4VW71_9BASI|nr:hypothetical protein PSTT_03404 [Puccinia striiformis]